MDDYNSILGTHERDRDMKDFSSIITLIGSSLTRKSPL